MTRRRFRRVGRSGCQRVVSPVRQGCDDDLSTNGGKHVKGEGRPGLGFCGERTIRGKYVWPGEMSV